MKRSGIRNQKTEARNQISQAQSAKLFWLLSSDFWLLINTGPGLHCCFIQATTADHWPL